MSTPHDTPREHRSWPRRLLNRLEMNQAVFYSLVLRGWQLLGGTVSVLLITTFFTAKVQGYYYTFGGLVALQSFFELGLGLVVAFVASHEWAHLRLNEQSAIVGQPAALARLVSLRRQLHTLDEQNGCHG